MFLHFLSHAMASLLLSKDRPARGRERTQLLQQTIHCCRILSDRAKSFVNVIAPHLHNVQPFAHDFAEALLGECLFFITQLMGRVQFESSFRSPDTEPCMLVCGLRDQRGVVCDAAHWDSFVFPQLGQHLFTAFRDPMFLYL